MFCDPGTRGRKSRSFPRMDVPLWYDQRMPTINIDRLRVNASYYRPWWPSSDRLLLSSLGFSLHLLRVPGYAELRQWFLTQNLKEIRQFRDIAICRIFDPAIPASTLDPFNVASTPPRLNILEPVTVDRAFQAAGEGVKVRWHLSVDAKFSPERLIFIIPLNADTRVANPLAARTRAGNTVSVKATLGIDSEGELQWPSK